MTMMAMEAEPTRRTTKFIVIVALVIFLIVINLSILPTIIHKQYHPNVSRREGSFSLIQAFRDDDDQGVRLELRDDDITAYDNQDDEYEQETTDDEQPDADTYSADDDDVAKVKNEQRRQREETATEEDEEEEVGDDDDDVSETELATTVSSRQAGKEEPSPILLVKRPKGSRTRLGSQEQQLLREAIAAAHDNRENQQKQRNSNNNSNMMTPIKRKKTTKMTKNKATMKNMMKNTHSFFKPPQPDLDPHLACSCFNATAGTSVGGHAAISSCCLRRISIFHKMGSVLSSSLIKTFGMKHLIKPYVNMVPGNITGNKFYTSYYYNKYVKPLPTFNTRYHKRWRAPINAAQTRHVVIIRNFADSIISGYLYHKAGHECWMDLGGNMRHNFTYSLQKHPWQQYVGSWNAATKLRETRNLCEYLSQETETKGIRAYMQYAVHKYYELLYDYYITVNSAAAQEPPSPLAAVKFMCYEDLSHKDPVIKQLATNQLMEHLFPALRSEASAEKSGTKRTIDASSSSTSLQSNGKPYFQLPPKLSSTYMGKHSTSQDPALRQRLADLIRKYDDELTNGIIQRADSVIGCSSGSSSSSSTTTR